MMRTSWLILAATMMSSCHVGEAPERLVVQVDLPASGMITGETESELMIVEFGSFACPYCQMFQDSVYPGLTTRYVQPGKASFRFISVDSAAPMVRLSAWVACAIPKLGLTGALREAFTVLNRDSLPSPELKLPEIEVGVLSTCLDAGISTRLAEARAAGVLGIQTVPTFLVGAADSTGHVVGWVVEGLHEARLDSTIQAASELLRR